MDLDKIKRLARQPSTWGGIGGLGFLGVELQPELIEQVMPWLAQNPWILAAAFAASLIMDEQKPEKGKNDDYTT